VPGAVRLRDALGAARVLLHDDVVDVGDIDAQSLKLGERERRDQRVVAGAQVDGFAGWIDLAEVEDEDRVVAGAACDRVGAVAGNDEVRAVGALDRVVAGAADDDAVVAQSRDRVVAAQPDDALEGGTGLVVVCSAGAALVRTTAV